MGKYTFDTKKIITEIDEFSEFIIENANEYDATEVVYILMTARARLLTMAEAIVVANETVKKTEQYAVGPSEIKKKK